MSINWQREVEGLNRMLREHGYGQGQIDCYVDTAEENDALRSRVEALESVVRELISEVDCTNVASFHRRKPKVDKALALLAPPANEGTGTATAGKESV